MSPIELDLLYARPLGSRHGYADLKSARYRRHLENLLLSSARFSELVYKFVSQSQCQVYNSLIRFSTR